MTGVPFFSSDAFTEESCSAAYARAAPISVTA